MSIMREFKEFAMRGSVIDLAIGMIVGLAFNPIVQSLVKDIIMPPIGILLGKVDFSNLYIQLKAGATSGPYASLAEAQAAGAVTINYGMFLNTIIAFLITGFAVFLVAKTVNNIRRRDEEIPEVQPTTKDCPYCLSTISIQATRCAFCTSEL